MKVQSLFKGNKAAAKPATTKASAPAKKAASGGKAGGWLGSGSQNLSLDKWYGPDRKLFLPGGLLDSSDIPSYLNGTLPGE
jgi:light-harvesting complex II chlorophyll a/b binding protein 5